MSPCSDLGQLTRLCLLAELDLGYCSAINDADAAVLPSFASSLQVLSLQATQVGGRWMATVAHRIAALAVPQCWACLLALPLQVTVHGLRFLHCLTRLRNLNLAGLGVR